MRIIISFFTLISVLTLLSCNNEIEPLKIEVNGVPKKLDQIKAYKTTDHPIMLVWYKSWKADGNMNSYLNTLPDSIDMIIVEQATQQINSAQNYDLETVRRDKGTRVIPQINIESWANAYLEKLEEAQDDEDNNAVAQLKEKFTQEWNELLKDLWQFVEDSSYDGICIRVSDSRNEFISQKITSLIIDLDFNKKANQKILIMEGNLHSYSSYFSNFDYLIHTSLNQDKLAYLQEEYDILSHYPNFDSKRLLLFFSMEKSSWQTPYPDIISSQALSDPKYKTLAYWYPTSGDQLGGMAIDGIEANSDQNYSVVRSSISFLNLK